MDIEMPRHYNEAFRKVCIFKRLSGDRLAIEWRLSGGWVEEMSSAGEKIISS